MTDENRGLFVVLEGGDGAGKTTQLSLLEQWLTQRGVTVDRTREPGGTPIGERIRALVLEHGHGEVDPRTEALLFAASRAAHVQQRILPALRRGALVLCDRYVDSSVAYQGVGRGLGAASIAELNDWATSGLTPDLTVVLDIDPAVSRARQTQRDGGAADRMESADDAFRARLRAAFLDRAAAAPQRYLVVDAAAEPVQIHQQIQTRLQPMLKNSAVAP